MEDYTETYFLLRDWKDAQECLADAQQEVNRVKKLLDEKETLLAKCIENVSKSEQKIKGVIK